LLAGKYSRKHPEITFIKDKYPPENDEPIFSPVGYLVQEYYEDG
jgi:hypothetical protein